MKRCLFLFATLLAWSSALLAQQSTRYAIYFETGRHELGDEACRTLDLALKELQYPEDYSVDIFAHTDSRGSEDYNLKLAERRAQSVTRYLAERGLKTEKTSTESLGESDPAFDNEDESGRKLNRRVDLVVNIATLQSLDELTERLSDNRMQYFTISPEKSVLLTGNKGTTLWIEGGSFEFSDGSGDPNASVEIALRETYSVGDMVLADLTTTCGDKLLETAGMIYVNATSNGKPLQLKNDAQIAVAMPAASLREGMQLFLGEQNAEGRLTNWQATGQGYQTGLEAALNLPPMPRLGVKRKYKLPVYKPDYSQEPREPLKPREPYKPVAPKRETIIYRPGFMDRLVMGKEKIKQKEEAMYQKQVDDHARHMKHYDEVQYPAYLEAMAKYNADKASYPARVEAWKEELEQKKAAYYNSRDYLAVAEKYEAEWKAQEAAWQKRVEIWQAEKEKKLAAFEAQGLNSRINNDLLNAYIYQVNRLGWVNCDVFSNDSGPRTQLAIRDNDDAEERIYVILKDRSSMLSTGRSRTNPNLYIAAGIPVSTPLKILAIKLVNGHPMMAIRETRAGEETEYQLNYKRCSPLEIRKALQEG